MASDDRGFGRAGRAAGDHGNSLADALQNAPAEEGLAVAARLFAHPFVIIAGGVKDAALGSSGVARHIERGHVVATPNVLPREEGRCTGYTDQKGIGAKDLAVRVLG
jgi:hypothetical protein